MEGVTRRRHCEFYLGKKMCLRLQGEEADSHSGIRQQGEQIEGNLGQSDASSRSQRRRQSQVRQESSVESHRQAHPRHVVSFQGLDCLFVAKTTTISKK